jgi:hypothetical protein
MSEFELVNAIICLSMFGANPPIVCAVPQLRTGCPLRCRRLAPFLPFNYMPGPAPKASQLLPTHRPHRTAIGGVEIWSARKRAMRPGSSEMQRGGGDEKDTDVENEAIGSGGRLSDFGLARGTFMECKKAKGMESTGWPGVPIINRSESGRYAPG